MATTFIDSIGNCSYFTLTSDISDVRAYTDKAKINVSISCLNGQSGITETFYSTSIYSFDGIVEISDVGFLIEEYFRQNNKVTDLIKITFDDVSVTAKFLYCEYAMPDAFDQNHALLLASGVQRVHADSIITFAYGIDCPDPVFIIKAVGHNAEDGSITVIEQNVSRQLDSLLSTQFFVRDIIRWATNQSSIQPEIVLSDLLYFSIEFDDSRKTFYLIQDPAYLTFTFRNIFNVEEYIDIVGLMTTKSDISRETAVSHGQSKHYDRNITRSYEIQTQPLTSDEIPLFEQFLGSHNVRLYYEGNYWPILITDQTCEPNTDDESLTTIKFSWKFADRRPRFFSHEINGITTPQYNIFNNSFTSEYA